MAEYARPDAADDATGARDHPDVVQEALDRFAVCVAAEEKQREREVQALEFQVPEKQWPAEVKLTRGAQTVRTQKGEVTIAARPMLAIPKLDQPIQLVLNQERAAHLGIQVHPLNDAATDATATILQGLYRAIEVDSRASLARSWAFERLVKAGRGVYRILKEYDETSDHPSDQKIVIKRIYEQGAVYFDPAACEPDSSDAEYAFVVEDVPLARYKRRYKDSALCSYTDEDFVALGNERKGWITGEKDAIAIRVCEYFYLEYQTETVTWEGGGREKPTRIVHWCTVNAVEELAREVWDGQYIPLVRLARELVPFDGDKRCVGMIEPNKDAQRLFNYAASASVEMAALETKASHAVDPRQIEGYEAWWDQKNVRNFAYLPFRRMVDGQDLGPPVPIQADMSKMQINALLLSQAGDFIQAGTAMFDPSLGDTSPNARTKGGTLALQSQSDQATSHWVQILADIGMTHEARIVLDLIPHVYDRPGRVARILDTEDNTKQVMLNAPFVRQGTRPVPAPLGALGPRPLGPPGLPPGPPPLGAPPSLPPGMAPAPGSLPLARPGMPPLRPQGAPGAPAGPGEVEHYDLKKGRYGVTVSVGKAYQSLKQEGQDALASLFQAQPQLFSVLGDIYLKFADFPGHNVAAERVKKMLPPALQDQDAQGQAQTQQQLAQAQAQIQQLTQALQALEPEKMAAQVQIATTQAKVQADTQQAALKSQADVEIARMNNATKVLVARITAAKEASNAGKEDFEERLALAADLAHDAEQQHLDRRHEVAMAAHTAALQPPPAAPGPGEPGGEEPPPAA
jgi:hypothetical protein